MPWEERGGRRYYYRKVRKGSRVFSVYEGAGLIGTLAAQRDEIGRETRRREASDLRAELAKADAVDAKIEAAWLIVRRAADEVLEAAGYHRHKRQWRLKRDATQTG